MSSVLFGVDKGKCIESIYLQDLVNEAKKEGAETPNLQNLKVLSSHSIHCHILSSPWYNSPPLSLSFSVTPSTVLFSSVHVLMSQDYLKTALPSQVMSERGSNLVVINPGMRKIQFCTLPTCYLLPIITSTRSKSKLEHLKIVTLLR